MPDAEIKVSFVVPCFGSRATVGRTLDAILSQESTESCQVILVESSADGTAAEIRGRYPSVQVIESNVRLLPGEARNRGARAGTGDLLAFIDADAEPRTNWLSAMRSALDERPERVLAGGWVRNANPTLASRLQHWIEFSEYLPGLPSGKRERLSSSNWLLRRDHFEATGGFSATIAMSEDSEFCTRLKGDIYFESLTGVAHLHREDIRSLRLHLRNLGYWSGQIRTLAVTPGSWLRHAAVLAYLLPFYRAPRICRRLFRASVREGMFALLLLPLLLTGLLWWSSGFYRGLKGFSPED